MTLTMRLTGLCAGIDKDRPDYTVYTGEWEVGRICSFEWYVLNAIRAGVRAKPIRRERRLQRSWRSCRRDLT
jgi:hypothetical protein